MEYFFSNSFIEAIDSFEKQKRAELRKESVGNPHVSVAKVEQLISFLDAAEKFKKKIKALLKSGKPKELLRPLQVDNGGDYFLLTAGIWSGYFLIDNEKNICAGLCAFTNDSSVSKKDECLRRETKKFARRFRESGHD